MSKYLKTSGILITLALIVGLLPILADRQTEAAGALPAGLILGYSFDETSGTTALDQSGNNFNGTLVGNPTRTVNGKYGGAITFDGVDDRVIGPTALSLPGTFTLTAWVNNPVNNPYETIMTTGKNRDFYLTSGAPSFSNGTDRVFGSPISTGAWHHVAAVSNGITVTVYVNGVQWAAPQNVVLATTSAAFQVGAWISGSSNLDFFSGTLDEVRVYNRALSLAEIQTDLNTANGQTTPPPPPPPPPPVPPPVPPPPPAGNAGTALRFYGNGVNDIDRVKIPLEPNKPVNVGSDFTLEFWLKAASTENISPVCGIGNNNWIYGNIVFDRDVYGAGDFGDWGISIRGGVVAFGVNNGSAGAGICSSQNVLDGQWHHIAATRSAETGIIRIFVDGIQGAETVGPTGNISYNEARSTIYPNDPYLVIGAEKHDAGAQFPSFNGIIDEVRLSNTIRYDSNFTRPVAPFITDALTAALYHFNEAGTDVADSSGAVGGPSNGVINFGGNPVGPVWVTSDAPLGGPTPPPQPPPPPPVPPPVPPPPPPPTPPPPASSLITAFGFSEGSGASTTDASGQNNTGVITGASWVTTGRYGNALSFNGNGNQVNTPILSFGPSFTIEAWINNPTNGSYETVATVGKNRDFYLRSGRLEFYDGVVEFAFNGPIVSNNIWHQVAVTYDGATLRAYLDGVPYGATRQATLGQVSARVTIGAWITSDFFSGLLDEVRVYNRALNQIEIQTDMATII